jgi:cephalosporin-C deacetylase-like acetyl esterase
MVPKYYPNAVALIGAVTLWLPVALWLTDALWPPVAWAQEATNNASMAGPLAVDIGQNRRQLDDYFRRETAELTRRCLAEIQTADDWQQWQTTYRRQLAEMLGLEPAPLRTDLEAQVVGRLEQPDFWVERLHFQSLPGLYVTANLYRPVEVTQPLPAILYLCGHARVKEEGVSFGNKTGYHQHGVWFAQHGYVCLMIDTIQLGEIEGLHHGTHHLNQWWWNSRGYTPAGVEAWNAIRAIDYLETRTEVDGTRIGVTGRSGGGAYSWWVAALDPRIAAAVPVAGITSLHNHVVDGCVQGHCDCMYMVNTYRWDFPLVAALVAPRPLLISNSDQDPIFPLEGVIDVHQQVRRIYRLLGAEDQLGLNITPGPHTDTQDLQVPAFRWFNRFLKKSDEPIQRAATKVFAPQQLRVFDQLPTDQRVTSIQEDFIPPVGSGPWPNRWLPNDVGVNPGQRPPTWLELQRAAREVPQALAELTFAGWPTTERVPPLDGQVVWSRTVDQGHLTAVEFTSQESVRLPMYIVHRSQRLADAPLPTAIDFHLLDDPQWSLFRRWVLGEIGGEEPLTPDQRRQIETAWSPGESAPVAVFFSPRGIGPTDWTDDPDQQIHIRRRFMLLGQTWGGMQVWDLRRAVQVVREDLGLGSAELTVHGHGPLGGLALFAALLPSGIARINLQEPPADHRRAIDLLNVARVVEPVQLAGLLNSQGIDLTIETSTETAAPWREYQRAREQIQAAATIRSGEFVWRPMRAPSSHQDLP